MSTATAESLRSYPGGSPWGDKHGRDPGTRPSVQPIPAAWRGQEGPWSPFFSERFGTTFQPVVVYGDQVLYALQPKQLVTYKKTPLHATTASHKHNGYGGAAGGGKSYLARATAAAVAHKWPGSTGIIFRQTRDEVIENHLKPLREEVPEEFIDVNLQRLEVFWKYPKSYTLFGFLRRDDDVYRYQGNSYDFMCFEEATHYSHWAVNWLTGNRLRASVEGARPFALYPSNPGNQGHFWFKRLFIDRNYRYDPELPEEEWQEDPREYCFTQAYLEDNRVLMVRDPGYIRMLNSLQEPERSWLKHGDWSAGAGLAIPELNRAVHLIDPFRPPDHWRWFGSFDWGFEHPWCFGVWCVNEDGRVYLVDSFHGRRDLAPQIARQCADKMRHRDHIPIRPDQLIAVHAGHDTFATQRSRGDDTPHRAEAMQDHNFAVVRANIDRVHGLNTLREYVAWKGQGPDGGRGDPGFQVFDTPGNRRTMEVLETRVTDPDDPEDVLKTHADDFGEGGDDPYDMVRYGIASRPPRPKSTFGTDRFRSWSREALEAEYEAGRRGQPSKRRVRDRHGGGKGGKPTHPELGRAY